MVARATATVKARTIVTRAGWEGGRKEYGSGIFNLIDPLRDNCRLFHEENEIFPSLGSAFFFFFLSQRRYERRRGAESDEAGNR